MVFIFSLVSVCDSVNVQKIALFIFKVQGETENFLPEAFVEMRIL